MKKRLNNYSGLTLVENLAVIVLLFIVMLFVFGILSSSSKQNKEQTAESFQINDAAYTLKQITKDIRKTHHIDTPQIDQYLLMDKGNTQLFNYTYDPTAKTLSRNNGVIVNNIEEFKMIVNEQTATISFQLNKKDYTTTLAFRKGDE